MSVRRALNYVGRSSRQVIAALLLAGVAPLFAQQSIDSDMPEGQAGQIDEATYLRLRSEHIARLRGVLAGKDPAARGRAVRAMAAQEERVRAMLKSFKTSMGAAGLSGRIWTAIDRKSTRLNSSHIPLSRM